MLPTLAALLLAVPANPPVTASTVADLRCEYRLNPLGIDATAPRLSWRIVATPGAKGVRQKAYRILVASAEAKLLAGVGDLWDSGKLFSPESTQVAYAGARLKSGVQAFWKVQVWDQTGLPLKWSPTAKWTMGLLDPADWSAKWIGRDEAGLVKNPDSPYHWLTGAHWIWSGAGNEATLTRAFDIPAGRTIRRATLIAGAENRYKASLNGTAAAAGDSPLMPDVADVTALVHPGANKLEITATHGASNKKPAALIAALRVDFDSGDPMILRTNNSWPGATVVGAYGMEPWGDAGFREERWLPARLLRKEFDAKPAIARATAYISGLGLSELYVNGAKIGNDVLSPGLTDYTKRVLYVTHDITAQLKPGARNALGVMLGNGRYWAPRVTIPIGTVSYGYPKVRLQVDIEYTNGDHERIVTDESWKLTTDGPVRGNNEYDGEVYDARTELAGWAQPGFRDTAWTAAAIVEAPAGVMVAQTAEPIRVTETIKPLKVTKLRPGVFIFDMGQNMVGWCRLHVQGPKGTVVRLRHAETLQNDGSLYLANLRSARATDEYILKGGAAETWEPRFTYHGFRYVEVTGYPGEPTTASLEGRVVNDDLERVGTFESSDALLNQLHRNTYWGMRGNYHSIPTDCPQRDERQGWLGDRSQVSRSETHLFNVAAFYSKWVTDIADSQKDDGTIPDVAPAYWRIYTGDVTWPSTFILVPGNLYEQYGDTRVIERNYDAMKKYMKLMEGFLENGLLSKDTYGDWCVPPESPELIHSKDPARQTNKTLLATAYYYALAAKMAQYARILERPQDAAEFDTLAVRVRAAFETRFFQPSAGLYDNGTQTSSLIPLAFGISLPAERPRVLDALVERIHKESSDHIGTGLIGAQWLMRVLSDNGHADLALKIATQRSYPGWGYMVDKGATTVWELWNGDTADPAMNSGNHVMQIGDLTIWMYERLGGLQPDPLRPGYRHFFVKPVVPQGLDWVKVTRRTLYGDIRTSWKRDKGTLTLSVDVPPNTTATILVPGDSAPHDVESGSYSFTSKLP